MSSNSTARCIYCLQGKALADFNTEHVLHRAFGGFEGALTLVAPYDPGVCWSCNDHFSKTIDLAITRDSIEALLRVDTGLKSVHEMQGMFKRRLTVRLPESHEFGPLYLTFLPGTKPGEYVVAPSPQVRFAKRGGGYKCLTEEELKVTNPKDDPEIDTEKKDLFWNQRDDGAGERIISLLAGYGLSFKRGKSFQAPEGVTEIDTETQWFADRVIARAVAKIAFNYLAKVSGAISSDFVFKPMFDDVRRFIREDDGKARRFVQVTAAGDSLLPEDRSTSQDHILALKWEDDSKGHILGFVKLFGYAEYVVRLANNPTGVWLDIGSAHAYELENRTVVKGTQGRFVSPPGPGSRTSGIIAPSPRAR